MSDVGENSGGDSHGEGAASNEEIRDQKGSSVSVIWKWFGFLKSDKEQNNVRWKLCCRQVATKSGNTTNLFQHLKQNHSLEHAGSLSSRHDIDKRSSSTSQSRDVCPKQ